MRTTRRHGPPPLPRRRLNPLLYTAVRGCGLPGWQIARDAGLKYPTALSQLVTAESVTDTPLNVERLQRIAAVVGFDKAQLFLDDCGSR